MKQLTWDEYYNKFYDWSESTQARNLSALKNLPEDLIDAIKHASSSEGADIRIEKTIASGMEITIKVRSRAEELDLEGL